MDDARVRELSDIEAYIRKMREDRPERIRNFERIGMNMKDVNDTELFVLIQTLGLVEAIQREAMTTGQSMQSVFSARTIRVFQEMDMDGRLISLLMEGMELKDDNGQLTKDVIKKTDAIRNQALKLLKEVLERRPECCAVARQQQFEEKLEEEIYQTKVAEKLL